MSSQTKLQCPTHGGIYRFRRALLPAAGLFAMGWLLTIFMPRSWEIPGQLGIVVVLTGVGVWAAWELWAIAHQCPMPCTCSTTDTTDTTEKEG